MKDAEKTSTLNPEIKDAAILYVKDMFGKSDDSDLIRELKKHCFKRLYKQMIVDPDEFQPKPRPAGVEPWRGPKPDGPDDFIKSKVVLPSLSQVLVQIQKVISDPDSSATDLAGVISKDPKLVAAILRLANSSMFSFRNEIDTPSRAVALLGFKQAGSLALGTVSLSLFKRPKGDSVLQVEKFWKHSMACGVIAQELARMADLGDPERFFVGGMLHDIGLYVIFESDKSLALEIKEQAQKNDKGFYGAEVAILGFNHAELGGTIIKKWDFPEHLVAASSGHHNPAEADYDIDAAVVHVADYISRAMGYDLGITSNLGKLDAKAWGLLNLSSADLIAAFPAIQEMIDDFFEILTPQ